MSAENKLRPTPETDAQVITGNGVYCKVPNDDPQIKFETIREWIPADFARRLERERDEAVEIVRDSIEGMDGIEDAYCADYVIKARALLVQLDKS